MDHKNCKDCLNIFPLTEEFFYKRIQKNGKKYFHSYCKECSYKRTSIWAKNNKKASRESKKKWKYQDYRGQLLSSAKHRAKKDGIPFDITLDDIPLVNVCPVFNTPLIVGGGKGPNRFSPSLDKIVPSLGYVKGNIQVISHLANSMKQDATHEQLNQFADWIKNGIHFKQEE